MERKITNLPCNLAQLASDWTIDIRGRSAGEGVTGDGQVLVGLQPRWSAILRLSNARREQVLTWRAIKGKLRGRVNILRVCLCDKYRPTLKSMGFPELSYRAMLKKGIPHNTGAYFDNGVGYHISPTIKSLTELAPGTEEFPVVANAISRALTAGNYFSYDDWLYLVTGIYEKDGYVNIQCDPPLNRAIPQDAEIRLEATALMAFVTDLEGRANLTYGKFGEVDINLVQWTNRP